LVVGSYLLLIF